MRKIVNNRPIALLVISFLLTSCYSSRTFQYKFTDANKAIIREVLSHGKVSCENCYLNGACVQIIDSIVTKDKYELNGKCALYGYHVTSESLRGGEEIKIKVKCALIIGRSKPFENYFLDEVGGALFDGNPERVRSQLKVDNSKQK